jgi:hypothetical protein
MVDAFGTREHMPPTGLWIGPAASLPTKGEAILAWLAQTGAATYRVVIVLDQNTDRFIALWAFQPLLSGDGHAYHAYIRR